MQRFVVFKWQTLSDFAPTEVVGRLRWTLVRATCLVLPVLGCTCLRVASDPVGDAVQPTRDGRLLPNGSALLHQHEKGLEGVLGIGFVAEHMAADTQHH
jgi:hypothetical protein